VAERPALLGGFAEYCHLLPGTDVLRLPDAVTDAEAATVNCAGATMAAVVETAEVGVGDCVVVQGLGALGLWGIALARAAGARAVIGLDVVEDRLAMAWRFGADLVLRADEVPADRLRSLVAEHSQNGGADVAIETAGAAAALQQGLGLLRPGGRYVTAGLVLPSAPVELDASALVRGMLTLRGVHNYGARHLARALDFAERTRETVPLASLVDLQVPLDAIDKAFALAAGRRSARIAVVPSRPRAPTPPSPTVAPDRARAAAGARRGATLTARVRGAHGEALVVS